MASEVAKAKVRKFVETYAAKGPYGLYPEAPVVENVIDGLAENLEAHGKMFCPCVPIDDALARGREFVCPCTPHHEDIARQGHCDCSLFAAKDFVVLRRPVVNGGVKGGATGER